MTLSDDRVLKALNKNFVCGRRNIKGQTRYAGSSNTHLPEYSAVCVNNSSGHHNVQMFFLTQDGKVLHCLPGFWSADHFLHEVDLALALGKLYHNEGLSAVKRNELFLDQHLKHALQHDARLRNSSELQGFDKGHVAKKSDSDFKREAGYKTGLKTADQVMHERMAERPFVRFEKFAIEEFIDMGIKQYKYDHGVPMAGDSGDKKDPSKKSSKKPRPAQKSSNY